MQAKRTIDVLIITALHEEYVQVREVSAGASAGSEWETRPGPLGHEVAFRSFASEHPGQRLEVAVTWAAGMGGVATASEAERLIAAYAPRCLAMCGVCAGRRGDVNIGDVIIADRLWMYDTGKLKVEYDSEGNRVERVQGDMLTYNLRSDWKKAAEAFAVHQETVAQWGERPRPIDMQANWILERIVRGEDPRQHSDVKAKAPNFAKVMDLLWKQKLLQDGTFELTETGKRRIDRLLLKHYDGLPELGDFEVRVGPIGSGNKVVQDPQIFERLSESMRKVIGLEMEAVAIGAVAHDHQDYLRYVIVMKGVMDHADEWKNDAAKVFAARASAECLIAFIRKHLPPVEQPAKGQNVKRFEHEEILALHSACISSGLATARSSLMAGIAPGFVASLPEIGAPSQQVLSDLHSLNAVGLLADGTSPFETWLSNAIVLTGLRTESAVFKVMLERHLGNKG